MNVNFNDSLKLSITRKFRISKLMGFREKNYQEPKMVYKYENAKIENLLKARVKSELSNIRDRIRQEFDFSDDDCSDESVAAEGVVKTPHFDFRLTFEQNRQDCKYGIERRSIEAIRDLNSVFSDVLKNDFLNHFGESSTFGVVGRAEVKPTNELVIENIVDRLKTNIADRLEKKLVDRLNKNIVDRLKMKGVSVEYNEKLDGDFCKVTREGHDYWVEIRPNKFTVLSELDHSPEKLISSMRAAVAVFRNRYGITEIEF